MTKLEYQDLRFLAFLTQEFRTTVAKSRIQKKLVKVASEEEKNELNSLAPNAGAATRVSIDVPNATESAFQDALRAAEISAALAQRTLSKESAYQFALPTKLAQRSLRKKLRKAIPAFKKSDEDARLLQEAGFPALARFFAADPAKLEKLAEQETARAAAEATAEVVRKREEISKSRRSLKRQTFTGMARRQGTRIILKPDDKTRPLEIYLKSGDRSVLNTLVDKHVSIDGVALVSTARLLVDKPADIKVSAPPAPKAPGL